MSAERVAEVLAAHQVESRGMSGGTPDRCTCGARVMPAPGDDDILARRHRAFAAHQAEALAAGLLAEPTDQDQRETRTEWGVRRNHATGSFVAGSYSQRYSQRHAEVMAEAWDGTVVRREITTGPWVEAPDPSP